MKYLESRKFSRYNRSKNVSALRTGFAISWNSLCQDKEYSADHNEVFLVHFSSFEPINLTPNSLLQRANVPMLYDTASNPHLPWLYICLEANVLGRAPLIPCFIQVHRR